MTSQTLRHPNLFSSKKRSGAGAGGSLPWSNSWLCKGPWEDWRILGVLSLPARAPVPLGPVKSECAHRRRQMTSIVFTGCRTVKGHCSRWPRPSLLRALNITGISKWATTSRVINFMSSRHSVTNPSWNTGCGWGIPECAASGHKADEPARKVACLSAQVHPWAVRYYFSLLSMMTPVHAFMAFAYCKVLQRCSWLFQLTTEQVEGQKENPEPMVSWLIFTVLEQQ